MSLQWMLQHRLEGTCTTLTDILVHLLEENHTFHKHTKHPALEASHAANKPACPEIHPSLLARSTSACLSMHGEALCNFLPANSWMKLLLASCILNRPFPENLFFFFLFLFRLTWRLVQSGLVKVQYDGMSISLSFRHHRTWFEFLMAATSLGCYPSGDHEKCMIRLSKQQHLKMGQKIGECWPGYTGIEANLKRLVTLSYTRHNAVPGNYQCHALHHTV